MAEVKESLALPENFLDPEATVDQEIIITTTENNSIPEQTLNKGNLNNAKEHLLDPKTDTTKDLPGVLSNSSTSKNMKIQSLDNLSLESKLQCNKCKIYKKMLQKKSDELDAKQWLLDDNAEKFSQIKDEKKEIDLKNEKTVKQLIENYDKKVHDLERDLKKAISERNELKLMSNTDNVKILTNIYFALDKFDDRDTLFAFEDVDMQSTLEDKITEDLNTLSSDESGNEENQLVTLQKFSIMMNLLKDLEVLARISINALTKKALYEIIGEEVILYMSAKGQLEDEKRPSIPTNIKKSILKIYNDTCKDTEATLSELDDTIDLIIRQECERSDTSLKLTKEQQCLAFLRLQDLKKKGHP